MIAVDTSALIAILANEPEARQFIRLLVARNGCVIGAPTFFELLMVGCGQRKLATEAEIARLLQITAIEIVPWTPPLADIAQSAFRQFGKGRHSAKLNFGDCISYALAKSMNCPLLYKGNDFAQTDIVSAIAAAD